MKRWAWTARAASRTRSSEIAEPRRMLEAMVPLKRCTSCSTRASDERSCGIEVAHVDAVQGHPALLHVVEAREQADDRGLAGPGRAHQGDALPRLHREVDVLQHPERVG